MWTRTLSSIIGLPLLFGIIFLGGNYIAIAGLIITSIGLYEFYMAFKNHSANPISWAGYIATIALYGFTWYWSSELALSLSVFVFLITLLLRYLFGGNVKLEDISITILGVLYVSFNLHHITRIALVDNQFYIWYVFLIAWGTDTCAYFVGYLFGKRKLWEEISPKKTIEGAIGGVIGCTILTTLYAYILRPEFIYYAIILGVLGSVISQLGDLTASKIKRSVDIKDYGNIMPGHGGVLDRFDSIIFTAPLVYYFMVIVEKLML